MMRRFKLYVEYVAGRRTIREQMIFAQLFVGAIVLIFATGLFVLNDIRAFRKATLESMNSTAKVLAVNLLPTITFMDQKEAKTILESLKAVPDVTRATIKLNDGSTFASYGDAESRILPIADKNSAVYSFEENHLYFGFRLVADGEAVGILYLTNNLKSMRAELGRYAYMVFCVVLFALIVSLLLANRLQSLFSKPITGLLQVMRTITESGDYHVRAHGFTRRSAAKEIRSLSAEFDKMLRLVQTRDDELKKSFETLEQRVEERTRELKQAQETIVATGRMSALGEMSSSIAHEINNPLAIISARCAVLKKKIAAEGEKDWAGIQKSADVIDQTVLRIAKIIRGLRSIARDGDQDPFEKINTETVVQDALNICSARLKNHGVALRLKLDQNVEFEGRSTQISQVLLNLLGNACDAIEHLEDKWVEVETVDAGEAVKIIVTDSGNGIPESLRSRIMEPFVTTKEVGKGTGLGLSISKGICDGHGGKLEIDSQSPNTRFIITLPKTHTQTESRKAA